MRWRRNREADHIDVLARTAQLEMSLGMESWRDTVTEMNRLVDDLAASHQRAQSEQDLLLRQLRLRISRLESVIHKREAEYDRLQERFCAMREQHPELKL